ncbi:MAG: hypothetical protein HUU01_18960 [Saprospiraceae bacterium]|nr:hypothetical protein [Saprospiraceae bacterium]
MRKLFVISCLLALPMLAAAQQDLSAHLMRQTWQSNRSNPALLPDARFIVSLPGLHNDFFIENITYGDLIRQNAGGEDVLDVDHAISLLETNNLIRENLDIETLGLGIRFGKLALTAGHALRFQAHLDYPKTLPQLVWQGNAQFVGQTVSFGPDIQLRGYHEWSLGVAAEIIPGLTFAGRAKWLSGIADVSTSKRKLELTTSDDVYQLELDADFQVNSAGSLTYNSFEDINLDFNFGEFDTDRLFSENSGFAFDLGLRFQKGNWDIAASVTDIGQIDWKDGVKNYAFQGIYAYKGLDVAQAILEDSTDFGSVLDTLEALYQPTETALAYSTALPGRAFLSAVWQYSPNWKFSGLVHFESFEDRNFTAFAIGASTRLMKLLEVGGIYSVRKGSYANIGLNATLNLGPLQVMAATDNVITLMRPKESHGAHVRLGVNLLFGRTEADQ